MSSPLLLGGVENLIVSCRGRIDEGSPEFYESASHPMLSPRSKSAEDDDRRGLNYGPNETVSPMLLLF